MGSRPDCLRLAPAERAALERWSLAAYPVEACGVLLGRRVGDELVIEEVTLAKNLLAESSPSTALHAFDLDPAALVQAEDRAREIGGEVVGIWHSHPDAPAIPSDEDECGHWRGWCRLLVAVDPASSASVRAWFAGGRELALVARP